ncbi:MAG: phosphoglucosamine mutase [Erysipelotrichaceae bacterium]|nr:phosphoglucosamine mutase [Erysipelotrichaceae bacterium]
MGKYFGTDGIRGEANDTLSSAIAYNVGRFIGNYYATKGNGKIVIGKDTRLSSSMFESLLAAGISGSGCDVYELGYVSTPCLAYVAMADKFDCGVMISASHNPYTDNGIKIFGNNGIKSQDDFELLIEAYIDDPQGIEFARGDNIGKIIEYKEGAVKYKEWIKNLYPKSLERFHVLIDCANGSNSYAAKEVLEDLGCKVTAINDEPNGININRGCGSTHLEMLKEEVTKGEYDIGFAFDGDADRVLAVNSKGEERNGDYIMYVLSKYLKDLGELTNDTLVVTGYSNVGLHKAPNALSLKADVVDNGDKYVLESMLKNDFALGGEQSGHIIIKKDCNFGDGLKTALCLLNALMYYDCSLDEACAELSIFPQLQVNQKVRDKKAVMADEEILAKVAEIRERIAGAGQILVRASGTENLVRVMVEAESDELCNKYVYEVIDMIKDKGLAV